MPGMSPYFFRRNQALSPNPPDPLAEAPPPDIPEVDPIETLLENSLLNTPPAEQAQRDLALPNQEDYAPSTGRKVLSVLAAALGGYTDGVGQGIGLGRTILDSPYKNAMSRYNEKAKALGSVAALEEKELGRKRLGWGSILDRKARIAAEAQRSQDRQDRLNQPRPARQLKPEIEYDDFKVATGRVFDPDALKMIEVPGLKGFRKDGESPAILQKKNNLDQSILKAKDAMTLWADLKKEQNWPVIGNPNVGPGQGFISELLTSAGALNNPKVRDLHKIIQDMANQELYALSGAQINNKEYERLRTTLANTNKAEGAFETDLARFLKYHEAAKAGLVSENSDPNWTPESGAAAPGGTQVPPSLTTPVTEVPPVTPTVPKTRRHPLRLK